MALIEKYVAAFQVADSIKHISIYSTFHNSPTSNIETRWRTSKRHHTIFNVSTRRNNALATRQATPRTPKLLVLRSSNGEDNNRFENRKKDPRKGDPSPNKRQKRRGNLFLVNEDTNIVLSLLESFTHFLLQRFSFPSILTLLPGRFGSQEKIEVPLVYILSILISAVISPLITWGLITGFFGVYLALGTAFMKEYDDLGTDFDEMKNEKDEFDIDREEEKYNGILPLAAFTGALASAALLSPQGFALPNASFSLVTPFAVISVFLGGLAILMGIRTITYELSILEDKDTRRRIVQKEIRQIKTWDDALDKSNDRRKRREDND